MPHAHIDAEGVVLGWYSDEIEYHNPPMDLVELTDEQWQHHFKNPGPMKWVNGELSSHTPVSVMTVDEVMARRDHALSASDWTQLSDVPMNDVTRHAWQVYRQSLRDLARKLGVELPTPPTGT